MNFFKPANKNIPEEIFQTLAKSCHIVIIFDYARDDDIHLNSKIISGIYRLTGKVAEYFVSVVKTDVRHTPDLFLIETHKTGYSIHKVDKSNKI